MLAAFVASVALVRAHHAGPFIEWSKMQAVSPDHKVKVFLTNSEGGGDPPYDGLRFEFAALRYKPAGSLASTRGRFTGLSWHGDGLLIVTGRGLEPDLVRDGRRLWETKVAFVER